MRLIINFSFFVILVKISSGFKINENIEISYSKDKVTFKNFTSTTGLRNDCSELQSGYHDSSYGVDIYLSSIGFVEIINSTIQNIPSNIFEKITVKSFIAIGVQLEEVNRVDFESAKTLTTLYLSKNKIKKIDNMIFLHCKSLEIIDLSRNEISWIHDNSFEIENTKLKIIDLSFNKLTTIKEESFNFASSINFESNEISQIVKSIEPSNKMRKMEKLNLSNNKLKQFEFPDASINILMLENNEIESFNISGVVELDLRNNSLQELFIKNGTKEINAEHNKISKLKCEVNSELQTVRLSSNKLGNEVLAELKNVKNIKTLELSDNQVTQLSIDSFSYLEFLQRLQIDQNSISMIDFGFFSHQKNLESLNMSNNALSSINFHKLTTLTSLITLDISGNSLTNIKEHKVLNQILPKLKLIGIEGNDWDCVTLAELMISLTSQNIEIIVPVNPEKKKRNISGFKCTTNSSDELNNEIGNNDSVHLIQLINETKIINEKILTNLKTEHSSNSILILMIVITITSAIVLVFILKKAKQFLTSRRNIDTSVITYSS